VLQRERERKRGKGKKYIGADTKACTHKTEREAGRDAGREP
jgi:hypothetical protein